MWFLRAVVAAVLLLFAVGGWMMQTPPDDAKSNAALWLNEIVAGSGSWTSGFTPTTDLYAQGGLFGLAALGVVGMVAYELKRRRRRSGRRKSPQAFSDFDMPILASVAVTTGGGFELLGSESHCRIEGGFVGIPGSMTTVRQGGKPRTVPLAGHDTYKAQVESVTRAVARGTPLAVTPADGLANVRIIEQARGW